MAQMLSYEASLSNALARASAEGKFILGDFGRVDCVECVQSRAIWESPAVRGWLQSCAVMWSSDVDESQEWRSYASNLTYIALPLVAWIDPGNPGTRFHFRTGLVGPTSFIQHLTNQAYKYLPLMVLNLPGDSVSNKVFAVHGLAITNALSVGSVGNIPITNVMWRMEKTGWPETAFQPVTELASLNNQSVAWSQEVHLQSGSNVFASFAAYQNGRNSWTNRVPLVLAKSPEEPVEAAVLHHPAMEEEGFGFQIVGAEGRLLIIEESLDLVRWQPIATNVLGPAPLLFKDPGHHPGKRFYRVITSE